MEGKKISFGFMKTKKADKPLPVCTDERKEYIECVEEKSIKVVGGEEVKINEPLVIPLKPNTLITAERLKEIAEKVENSLEEPEIKQEPTEDTNRENPTEENETLDQMAIRELMQEAKKEVKTESPTMAIPTAAKTVSEGEKESTLDDYEAVPIQEFGMAMLRGMGWTPSKDGSKHKQPELRPKGLGLGADKVIKRKQKSQATKDDKGEELAIIKNSFVKITNGKYNGYYGKVISLDEDNGRVMVDIPVKKETVSLSEFMMQAVTKSEYDKESKVINADSFEEYKKKELSQKTSKQEEKRSSSQRRDEKEKDRRDEKDKERRDEKDKEKRDEKDKERRDEKDKERRDVKETERRDRQRETDNNDRRQRDSESANGRSKNRQRRDSSSSEDERASRKKKERKRYSSNDSLSSLSEDDRRQHKHSKHKSRRRRSRPRSETRKKSRTPEGKRDIDKKRKGKKKKRDRDRSPNYKKHRK